MTHGDRSPKNILLCGGHLMVLDAECATMGAPAFDPAFCLNHLLLKAVHLPKSRGRLLASVLDFWGSYFPHVAWEPSAEIEARVCALLPMLFLARVDGKSPVEYLSAPEQQMARTLAVRLIEAPAHSLAALVERVANGLKEIDG